MIIHVFRLYPNQDLRKEIELFAEEKQIEAGVLLSIVGSLKKAYLRTADGSTFKTDFEKYEIVSGTGTVSKKGCHIHVSLSDVSGKTIGGHLKLGCLIYTTAEIVIGEIREMKFERKIDSETGFKELKVKEL